MLYFGVKLLARKLYGGEHVTASACQDYGCLAEETSTYQIRL